MEDLNEDDSHPNYVASCFILQVLNYVCIYMV